MLSKYKICKVILTCYFDDFETERSVIKDTVIAKFENWSKTVGFKVYYSEIVWGGKKNKEVSLFGNLEHSISLENLCEMEHMKNNSDFVIFLNVSSSTLGWLPLRNISPNRCYRNSMLKSKLGLSDRDLDSLSTAYGSDSAEIENSIFLQRNDDFLSNITIGERSYFPPDDLIHHVWKIQQCPGSILLPYSYEDVNYDVERENISIDLLPQFSEQVYRILRKVAENNLSKISNSFNQFSSINKDMQNYINFKLSNGIVEEAIDYNVIKKLWNYILDEKECQKSPFILASNEKHGKSSTISYFLKELQKKLANKDECLQIWSEEDIFIHFVDGIELPTSTNLKSFLLRFIDEFNLLEPGTFMPNEVRSLSYVCFKALSKQTLKSAIVIVDGIDKFETIQSSRQVSWLSKLLPNNVRVIVTCNIDSPQFKSLGHCNPHIEYATLSGVNELNQEKLVNRFIFEKNIMLSEAEMDNLIKRNIDGSPIWLKIACDIISFIKCQFNIVEYIADMPTDFDSLLEMFIAELENIYGFKIVKAFLCLLKTSVYGLTLNELKELLTSSSTYSVPCIFEEKGEKEDTEKESHKEKCVEIVDSSDFQNILEIMHPFLNFFECSYYNIESSSLKRIIDKRYLKSNFNDESEILVLHWHSVLANFFENAIVHRKVEEFLPHLVFIKDTSRLEKALLDWDIFDFLSADLFNENVNPSLVYYWRMLGPIESLISAYHDRKPKLCEFKSDVNNDINLERCIKLSKLFLNRGAYDQASEIVTEALNLESNIYGARMHFLAELNSVMAAIQDEKLKLQDFLRPSQLTMLKEAIKYTESAIQNYSRLKYDESVLHLAIMLMKLAFDMESWEGCGGDEELSSSMASKIGKNILENAISVFVKYNNVACLAEALMTKGVLADKTSKNQIIYYEESLNLTKQFLGEHHILNSRLQTNMAIIYEDNKRYVDAYKLFLEWSKMSELIYGYDHPKAQRARKVLKEERYIRVAQLLEEQQQDNQLEITDDYINQEVEEIEPNELDDEDWNSRLGNLMNMLNHFQIGQTIDSDSAIEGMRTQILAIHNDLQHLQSTLPSHGSLANLPALRILASRLGELQEAQRQNMETERRLEYLREQHEQLQTQRSRLQEHRQVLQQQRLTLRNLHDNLETLQTEADDAYQTLQNLEDRCSNNVSSIDGCGNNNIHFDDNIENELIEINDTIEEVPFVEDVTLESSFLSNEDNNAIALNSNCSTIVDQLEKVVDSTEYENSHYELDNDGSSLSSSRFLENSEDKTTDICQRAKHLYERMMAMAILREEDIEKASINIDSIRIMIEEDSNKIRVLAETYPCLSSESDEFKEKILRETRLQQNIDLLDNKSKLIENLQKERENLLADSQEIARSINQLEGLNQILSQQGYLSDVLEDTNETQNK